MGPRWYYTRPNRTTTQEVILVSTPEHHPVGDQTDAGQDPSGGPDRSPARTAVQLDPALAMEVLGAADANLRALEELVDADLHVRGGTMTISGEPRPSITLPASCPTWCGRPVRGWGSPRLR